MTDNIEKLVLEQLRDIRADIASVKEDIKDIKSRLVVIESAVVGLLEMGD